MAANYVPAAAVIRRPQALLEFTGRKVFIGGFVSKESLVFYFIKD